MIDPIKGRYNLCNTLRYFHPYNVKEDADRILEEWDDVCNRLGIPHILIYGTCLGFYRDGGYVKNDTDIDVAVICGGAGYEAMAVALLDLGFYGRVHLGTNRPEDKHYFKREVMLGIERIPGDGPPWVIDWRLVGDLLAGHVQSAREPFTFKRFDQVMYGSRAYNVAHPVEDYLAWVYGDWRTRKLRPE